MPSPEETIRLYGEKLFHLHLKNSVAAGSGRIHTGLGEGEINHRRYLLALADSGYRGTITLEGCRFGDREWFVQKNMAYFRAVAGAAGLA